MNRLEPAFHSRLGRATAAIVVVAALAAIVATIPARARGGDADVAEAVAAPRAMVAERRAVVDPRTLRPATALSSALASSLAARPRPLRMRDSAGFEAAKTALSANALLDESPLEAALPMLTGSTIGASFLGLNALESCGGCEPPDTQVAAGPSHVVEVDNISGRIFDKSGNIVQTFNLNDLLGLDPATFTSDPRIRYDTMSQRWFISMLALDSSDGSTAHNGQIDVAVSTSSDPTQPFNIYTRVTSGSFPDQPELGFNDDKIVTSANAFSCVPDCDRGPVQGNEFIVWNKAQMVAGAPAAAMDFFGPDQDPQTDTIQPAKSRTSTSTLFMISTAGTTLKVWSVTGVPGVGLGSSASKTTLGIGSLNVAPGAVQKGSAQTVDTGDARILDAVFRDGELWGTADDRCTPAGDTKNRACMRFIQILTDSMTVNQDFDFGESGIYYYYPSVDLDSSDNLVSAFTRSSSSEFPSAYASSRLAGDPLGALGVPTLFKAGQAAYRGTRWGDYSGAGVDPADESMIWVAAEFSTNASGRNWGTFIAQVQAGGATPMPTPTPGGKLKVKPANVNLGKVAVGANKMKSVVVKNAGKGSMVVTIGPIAPPFTATGLGMFTLAQGQTTTAEVTFAPLVAGKVTGTLAITSSDPKHLSKSVKVTGTGK